jgi:hypothetical protein
MSNGKKPGLLPVEKIAPIQPIVEAVTPPVTNDVSPAPPAPAPAPPKPTIAELLALKKTYDEINVAGYTNDDIIIYLKAARKAALNVYTNAVNDDADTTTVNAAKREEYVAADKLTQFTNKITAEVQAKETAAKLNEYLTIKDVFAKAVFNLAIAGVAFEALGTNEGYKIASDKLINELKIAFGKQPVTNVIPMGMTGKQLERATGTSTTNGGSEGVQAKYRRLLREGMTVEQIMLQYPESVNAEGKPNGTLRTAASEVGRGIK